jgi:hypothetical protein
LDLQNTLVVEIQKGILLYSCHIVRKFLNIDTEHKTQKKSKCGGETPVIMLISTALLLDSIIRNSVCTPAKLPCRGVEVGYEKRLFALFVFLICSLTSGAFAIESSTPNLTGNLNEHLIYLIKDISSKTL